MSIFWKARYFGQNFKNYLYGEFLKICLLIQLATISGTITINTMASNIEKYKKELQDLIESGTELQNSIQYEALPGLVEKYLREDKTLNDEQIKKVTSSFPSFKDKYQLWYSESKAIIKLLLPDRLNDFIQYYEKPKNRKVIERNNYVIEDFLIGSRLTRSGQEIAGPRDAIPKFTQQLNILKSVERRFESSLFDLKQLVQADLFDSEIDTAKELAKKKFSRAAGAVAGVILEKHLAQVCSNHNLSITKKNPTINDFSELLKSNDIVDMPQWRFIQHLADIRNICDHNKQEPTNEAVLDLINGVDKLMKTLF